MGIEAAMMAMLSSKTPNRKTAGVWNDMSRTGTVPARLRERAIMRPIATHLKMHPKAKRVNNPALLLPASHSMVKNGIGKTKTSASNTALLRACPRNMAKNSLGSFVPQPMHLPCKYGFQFLAIGLQENSANRKKVKPHAAEQA